MKIYTDPSISRNGGSLSSGQKIGLFGGSFDPIHNGHLNLALQLLEKKSLDRVFFCPLFQSPFKKEKPEASSEERREMVRLAIQEIPQFELFDAEIERKGVSYTIDTIRSLRKKLNDSSRIYLLLSQDALSRFHFWKEAKEILVLATPLIGTRRGFSPKIPSSSVSTKLRKGIVATSQMEVSSTEIRKRLKKGLYCGHLLSKEVLDFILTKEIYQSDRF